MSSAMEDRTRRPHVARLNQLHALRVAWILLPDNVEGGDANLPEGANRPGELVARGDFGVDEGGADEDGHLDGRFARRGALGQRQIGGCYRGALVDGVRQSGGRRARSDQHTWLKPMMQSYGPSSSTTSRTKSTAWAMLASECDSKKQ